MPDPDHPTSNSADEQPGKTPSEVDQFIYRTAHDLRGPLATIKGLINLMKIRENNEELDHFVTLLETHANLLDERLFQLVYVAQSHHIPESGNRFVDFVEIETSLRKIIEQNAFVDFLDFRYTAPTNERIELDGAQLTGLLNNLLLYILSLTMASVQVRVVFRIRGEGDALVIDITACGFETSEPLQTGIQDSESFYSIMMQNPQLMTFFAARKIAIQLKASINVRFDGENTQHIGVRVPLPPATYSK